MTIEFPASTYPTDLFKQTTPDETQELSSGPKFRTVWKGSLTRSEIYERMLPDNLTCALRIDGPADSAFVLNNKGNIRIITGEKTDIAGTGMLGIKSYGQQQIHYERSNIQYNSGGSENEGQALNVIAYGDIVEQTIGGTRYIKAAKVLIEATEELVLNGQSIKLQAQGDIEMAAASFTTAQINKKEITIGQDMRFGAGESSDVKFDPRSSTNVISAGCMNHKVLGDYALRALGNIHMSSIGGAGLLIKDRTYGLKITTTTRAMYAGVAGVAINSPGPMDIRSADLGLESAKTTVKTAQLDIESADFQLDAAKATIDSKSTLDLKAVGIVKVTGSLIYLN
tara:strand:- start:32 stop:1051 length:1020 start_codon:yes stop_codon:yes gene_type:complete